MNPILKVSEWLKKDELKIKQFVIRDATKDEKYALRLREFSTFFKGDLVEHSDGTHSFIYRFCNDEIHFIMENGQRWQANHVSKLLI